MEICLLISCITLLWNSATDILRLGFNFRPEHFKKLGQPHGVSRPRRYSDQIAINMRFVHWDFHNPATWHHLPVRLVPNAMSHDFEGVCDDHKCVGVNMADHLLNSR